MPKIELSQDIVIDVLLYGSFINFIFDLTWPSCVPILAFSLLKGVSMYLPKKANLQDAKAQELEDKIAILKKEITATRMRIGLER